MILPVSLAVVISSLLLGVNADAAEVSEFNPLSCVGNSSLPCLSHKIISAFRRIRKIPEIPITEWMSLVPSADEENSTLLEEKPIVESRFRRQGLLWTIGEAVDDFLFSRSVRIALPNWATGSDHAVDLDVSRAFTQVTGRGKKHGGGGGGKKGGKMGMMVCMLMGKMMMLTMGMVKMKAMKAMMVAGMAMMLSVGQMMKSMMGGKGGETKHVIVIQEHGGGGGGGGSAPSSSYGVPSSGGGGGGWSGGGGGGSSGGGGWSGGGGGGGGGGWQGGGGGGGDTGGGYNYDQPASGGWGKRAYHYDTYITHPPSSNPNTTKP